MRQNREYQICRDIATYLRLQYPNVIFHFDLAGLNLSRAQAGMMKSIQGGKGWPDLFIAKPKTKDYGNKIVCSYHGLFIEIKKEGTKIFNNKGELSTPHIADQFMIIEKLKGIGYWAEFGIGFDHCKQIIDNYLNDRDT